MELSLEQTTYKNDEYNGDAVFYDSDGVVASEGKFLKGKKAGIWKFYLKGKLTKEINMSDPKNVNKASENKETKKNQSVKKQ